MQVKGLLWLAHPATRYIAIGLLLVLIVRCS